MVLPLVVIHRGMFFADTVRGVGAEFQSASGFYIGQAFNYDFGRSDKTSVFRPGSASLRGMGDVQGTVTSTLTAAQRLTPWLSINAQAEFALGDERGDQYQFAWRARLCRPPRTPSSWTSMPSWETANTTGRTSG